MEHLKVGILVSDEPHYHNYSKHVLSSLLHAISMVNDSGGIFNMMIEPVIYQDAVGVEHFKKEASILVNDNDIKAVFSTASSSYRKAILPLFRHERIPLFYANSYEGFEDESAVIYTASLLNQKTEHIHHWIKEQAYKKVFIISSASLRSQTAHIVVRSSLNCIDKLKLVHCYHHNNNVNLESILRILEAEKPDLVVSLLEDYEHDMFLDILYDTVKSMDILSLFVSKSAIQTYDIKDFHHYLCSEFIDDVEDDFAAFMQPFLLKHLMEGKDSEHIFPLKENSFSCNGMEVKLYEHGHLDVPTHIYLHEVGKSLQEVSGPRRTFPEPWLGVNSLQEHKKEALKTVVGHYPLMVDAIKDLSALVSNDTLTGLYNRSTLISSIEHAIAMCKRYETQAALLLLDLDNFKKINDSFGLFFGDALLVEVALRMKHRLRDTDVFARLGGDEFAVLIEKVKSRSDIVTFANKLMDIFSEPFLVESQKIYITASCGVSRFIHDDIDALSLLKNADIAMYDAKNGGKNSFSFYYEKDSPYDKTRVILENELHDAIVNNQLEIYFQPQVRSTDKTLVGAEALIRWNHPRHGLMQPSEFLSIADDAGLMHKIDLWVIEKVFQFIASWAKEDKPLVPIAVNISNTLFHHKSFLPELERLHIEFPTLARFMDLELTEHIMMKNPEETLHRVKMMKSFGFSISVDDFGTGYSSLNQLKHLPIGKLKIDRSFIKDIANNENDEAIVRAIVAMARSLNMEVIAEGVDENSQVDILSGHDCHHIQGYFYSEPIPFEDFNEKWALAYQKK